MFEDQSGDVSCNSYQLWEEDLGCILQLGLTHYRLSFSWARLLPDGTTRHVNKKGKVACRPATLHKHHQARQLYTTPL